MQLAEKAFGRQMIHWIFCFSASLRNGSSIIGLIGAVSLEANDECQAHNRYMQATPMAEFMAANTKPETIRISAAA